MSCVHLGRLMELEGLPPISIRAVHLRSGNSIEDFAVIGQNNHRLFIFFFREVLRVRYFRETRKIKKKGVMMPCWIFGLCFLHLEILSNEALLTRVVLCWDRHRFFFVILMACLRTRDSNENLYSQLRPQQQQQQQQQPPKRQQQSIKHSSRPLVALVPAESQQNRSITQVVERYY